MHSIPLPHPEIFKTIENLYQEFLSLNASEQKLLMVLSIIYKPVGITKLANIIKILVDDGFLHGPVTKYALSPEQREKLKDASILWISKEGLRVNPILANRLTTEIGQLPTIEVMSGFQTLQAIIMAAEEVVPVSSPASWQNKEADQQRLLRDLFFLGQFDKLQSRLKINKNPQIIDHENNRILVELLFVPFDLPRFLTLPMPLQYQAFATLFRECQKQGHNCQYAVQLLESVCKTYEQRHETKSTDCHYLLAEQYLFQKRFEDFEQLLDTQDKSSYGLQLLGSYYFLTGFKQRSLAHFKQALIAKNKVTKRKNPYLNELPGYFYKLALMVAGNEEDAQYFLDAREQIEFEERDRKVNSEFASLSGALIKPINNLSKGKTYNIIIDYNCVSEHEDAFRHQLMYFNFLLAHVWCNQHREKLNGKLALDYAVKFERLGYHLFSELCNQLADYNFNSPHKREPKLIDIATITTPKPEWDLALDQLLALAPKSSEQVEPEKNIKPVRLIWEFTPGTHFNLQAREQKLNKSGWSKGRIVALKRLKEEPDSFDYLTATDKQICQAITVFQGWGYYAKTNYILEGIDAIRAAVGIENLYSANNLSRPIELTESSPELLVSQQGDELCITIPNFSDSYNNDQYQEAYTLKQVSDYHYQLTVFCSEHIKVGEIIGDTGLLVPGSAKQKALDSISAIAPFLNIQSDMSELDTGLASCDCDPNLYINIQPYEQGLSFTCMVMPFGEKGPAFKPALGNINITADLNGQRLATKRDLQREETILDELDAVCPVFLSMSDNILLADELANALDVLEQLEEVVLKGNTQFVLRWPKGKKLSLSKKLKSEHLQLSVGKNKEWFDISGELQIDNEQVLELRKLLELVHNSRGRFIELGADQILVLSQDLRKTLEQINHITDDGRFHPLASLKMEEATQGMRMKTLHAWNKQKLKMQQANEIAPKLPSTFQGELRDYQLAGFDWAIRLSHWGAGACLADDMGLGKTLQALAVLLYRASDGPALIIAPTSVCHNWQQEALKFTPTLNIHLFADSNSTEERLKLLKTLTAFDCVIISYGLLQRESDLLQTVSWHTIIADEAQALKNPLAKRTKAAFSLKSDFKMITTGTPLENDLTELWSLFRFINPGLLGNIKRFADRFAIPIENAKDDKLAAHQASEGLKLLIQPFVLRRMKNQVLNELPSRTEITVPVKMSEQEQNFYEALRLNAVDNISNADTKANVGEQRIRMLAELTRLRQACCNPALISPEMNIPSAKLEALDELLEELRLNNHKALIFSQFVGHLQLIKTHIKDKGFSYQYLDGSTPQKDRQKRVNAFQGGDGELFLISLKAGGSGLNLTAADYVIHMDPWWNPAVEDQASDRAHRLGQKRPVTIYRLVTKDTIEEKIVALHQHKRDLADKVLAGNEVATKLSVEDMLGLLKDTF